LAEEPALIRAHVRSFCNTGYMVNRRFISGPLFLASASATYYVSKHGVPAAAKKVFIRIQQMKDYLGNVVYTTSAVVPAEEAWPTEARGAQILRKP
jgi:hypothetical protein